MPRQVDLKRLRQRALGNLRDAVGVYEKADTAKQLDYLLVRWMGSMVAVELYAVWERYAEKRLAAALNHHPQKFLSDNAVRGLTRLPSGLASVVIRTGARYFDFRSSSDLIDKADRYLDPKHNPFRAIPQADREYLDALSAVRNCVVHASDAAWTSYRRSLQRVYGIKSTPEPDEFLNARDNRASSPARYKSRLHGLAVVVERTIRST